VHWLDNKVNDTYQLILYDKLISPRLKNPTFDSVTPKIKSYWCQAWSRALLLILNRFVFISFSRNNLLAARTIQKATEIPKN